MPRVLIVEDNPDMQALVRRHLENMGLATKCVGSGQDALKTLEEELPDLMVSDIMMPGMDGFELFERVRGDARTASVPVVFLTALNDRETLLRALRAGVDDFVSKPFQRDELVSVIGHRLRATAATEAESDPWTIEQKVVTSEAGQEEAPEPVAKGGKAGVVLATDDAAVRFSFSDVQLKSMDGAVSSRETRATVLFCNVRDFATFRRGLNGVEVIEVLTQFFLTSRNTVFKHGGWLVKFLGDGFAAVFEDDESLPEGQEVRALKAALMVVLAAQRLRSWLRTRFPDRELEEFAVGIGLHTGSITVGTLDEKSRDQWTIAGENVERARQLEQMTKGLAWSIAASQATFLTAADILSLGRGANAPTESGNLLVAEVRGPQPGAASSQEQLKVFSLIEAAVESNTAAIAAAMARRAADKAGGGRAAN